MKIRATLLLAAVCFVVAAAPLARDDEAKKDLDKLQGEWVIVSAERNGMPVPKENWEGLKRTVKGEDFTVAMGDQVVMKGKYKLDPSKKPKAIDATGTNHEGQEVSMQGIYEFEGDTYKVCFAEQGKPRPTEFKTAENSGHTLTVSKKAGK
jgi:uncharacterized protein (TIGR03067 family)